MRRCVKSEYISVRKWFWKDRPNLCRSWKLYLFLRITWQKQKDLSHPLYVVGLEGHINKLNVMLLYSCYVCQRLSNMVIARTPRCIHWRKIVCKLRITKIKSSKKFKKYILSNNVYRSKDKGFWHFLLPKTSEVFVRLTLLENAP